MKSNIEFKSNIYPIEGHLQTDQLYLSKIYDFNRLYSLNRHFMNISLDKIWNKHQKRIIEEKPCCSVDNYKDPCWGMIKNGEQFEWVCKCINTECKYFKKCRPSFDLNELDLFSPEYNVLEGYSYEFTKYEGDVFPRLSTEKESDYGEPENPQKTQVEDKPREGLQFEATDVLDKHADEDTESAQEEKLSDDEQANEDFGAEASNSLWKGTHDNLNNINIFEYFEECEQENIIEASADEIFFIDAGPGTGKTYTLIQKINYLVTEKNIDPESILVLCFTNAAVDEIKNRLEKQIETGADRGLANVDIRTFHSFAWWLIGQANELFADDGWEPVRMQSLKYDDSIKTTSRIISKFVEQIFVGWGHFIVDEIQDLTNDLAQLVLDIIDGCLQFECGVTVFGDSCQAIYDYTQEHTSNPIVSEEFYNLLFNKLKDKGQFFSLTQNHRQTDELINLTSDLRKSILSKQVEKMKEATKNMLGNMELFSETGESITEAELKEYKDKGRICLLLRNNGQTLKLSSTLRKRGIQHTLNVAETNDNFAPWISEVFSGFNKKQISFDEFEERFNRYVIGTVLQPSDVWEKLKQLLHTGSQVLDVKDLLNKIYCSEIDDPIMRVSNMTDVIISNIHRSKGREYECVVLDQSFGENLVNCDNKSYEYKTMYVAVTRAKNELFRAPLQRGAGLRKGQIYATGRKRWMRTRNKKIINMEFNSDTDLNMDDFSLINQDIFSQIKIGDGVCLERILNEGSVDYQIVHENSERCLGKISKNYIDDIRNYMGINSSRLIDMPVIITDLYINGVYSRIVDEDYLKENSEIVMTAPNGVWKRVEIIGAGHFSYDVY